MSAGRIKELRKEARVLNAKAKATVAASGKQWLAMDADMETDFKRYLAIQAEIADLKAASK